MKLERLLGILIILLTKERVTANYLAEYFEVSKRTIYRDLDSLDLAGLPIATFSGREGGIELFNNYKLDTHVFVDDEKSLIINSLDAYKKIADHKQIDLLIHKIEDLTNDKLKGSLLKAVEVLKVSSLRGPLQEEVDQRFKTIEKGIHENRTVSFKYVNLKGQQSDRIVEPIVLRMNYGIWYLHGYCQYKEGFRVFKVTRMQDIKLNDETFEKKALPDLNYKSSKPLIKETITLVFKRNRLGHLSDYFTQEEIIEVTEESVTVTFDFRFEFEFIDLLLYFGSGILDIKPPKYKALYKKELKRIVDVL